MRHEARSSPTTTAFEKIMMGDMTTADTTHATADTMRDTTGVRYLGDDMWWQIAEIREIKFLSMDNGTWWRSKAREFLFIEKTPLENTEKTNG